MAELLSVDKDMAASFLNSVLNQLNWAFSEFIGMIQEVRATKDADPLKREMWKSRKSNSSLTEML